METAIVKCIAKGCKNKVTIKLTTTDLNNASELFFNFCLLHKKLFNDKIKRDFTNKAEIKKEIMKQAKIEATKFKKE